MEITQIIELPAKKFKLLSKVIAYNYYGSHVHDKECNNFLDEYKVKNSSEQVFITYLESIKNAKFQEFQSIIQDVIESIIKHNKTKFLKIFLEEIEIFNFVRKMDGNHLLFNYISKYKRYKFLDYFILAGVSKDCANAIDYCVLSKKPDLKFLKYIVRHKHFIIHNGFPNISNNILYLLKLNNVELLYQFYNILKYEFKNIIFYQKSHITKAIITYALTNCQKDYIDFVIKNKMIDNIYSSKEIDYVVTNESLEFYYDSFIKLNKKNNKISLIYLVFQHIERSDYGQEKNIELLNLFFNPYINISEKLEINNSTDLINILCQKMKEKNNINEILLKPKCLEYANLYVALIQQKQMKQNLAHGHDKITENITKV